MIPHGLIASFVRPSLHIPTRNPATRTESSMVLTTTHDETKSATQSTAEESKTQGYAMAALQTNFVHEQVGYNRYKTPSAHAYGRQASAWAFSPFIASCIQWFFYSSPITEGFNIHVRRLVVVSQSPFTIRNRRTLHRDASGTTSRPEPEYGIDDTHKQESSQNFADIQQVGLQ